MHKWITEKSSGFALCGAINESAISFEVELPGLKGHCEKLRTGTRWQYKLAQNKLGEDDEDQLQGYLNIWENASTVWDYHQGQQQFWSVTSLILQVNACC